MSSDVQEIEDFELSITSNAVEGTIDTINSISLTKKSRKTSPIHEHCRMPTTEERQKKPGSQWIWCKYCSSYPAQSTTNMRQHLESIHEITISKAPDSSIRITATETIEALYTKLLLQLGNSKEDLDREILRRTVDQQIVNQTLLDLIIV